MDPLFLCRVWWLEGSSPGTALNPSSLAPWRIPGPSWSQPQQPGGNAVLSHQEEGADAFLGSLPPSLPICATPQVSHPSRCQETHAGFFWICFILSCSELGGVTCPSAQEPLRLLTPGSQFDSEQLSWSSGLAAALIPSILGSAPLPVHEHSEGHPCAEVPLLILLTETQCWPQLS